MKKSDSLTDDTTLKKEEKTTPIYTNHYTRSLQLHGRANPYTKRIADQRNELVKFDNPWD